jgi:aromatic-L-amino-acid/L-tryptophan decarboxylase
MASPLDLTPVEFRHLAAQVTEIAAEYLANLDSSPTFPATSAAQVEQLFHTAPPVEGQGTAAFDMLASVVQHSRVQNGRFFGYVLGSGEPIGALADLFASVLNQNVTAWRSGPAAATIEHTVIEWLSGAIGCSGFHGSLAGGGSAANLMALAMAREVRLPVNERGLCDAPQGTFYASTEVHMSIPKSIALLGIGRENLRLIPTDDHFRMIPAELECSVARDIAAGKTPIAVIAQERSTLAPLTRCLRFPQLRSGIKSGSTLTVPTARWRLWLSPKNSAALN